MLHTDDVRLGFANAPTTTGKQAIHDGLTQFWGANGGLRYEFVQIVDTRHAGISEAVTVYTRKDGSHIGLLVTTVLWRRGAAVSARRSSARRSGDGLTLPSGDGADRIQRMTTKPLAPSPQQILKEPAYGQIAMLMPDGSPHLTQLWVDTDGERILVNTVATHRKVKNARRDPHVAVNVHDPAQQRRIADIRGRVVELPTAGADQQRIIQDRPETIHAIGLD